MSFPHHDENWTAVADFVGRLRRDDDRILSPDEFWWVLDSIFRYRNTHLRPAQRYDWAIIHKGRVGDLEPAALESIAYRMTPVLANEVFVVLTSMENAEPLSPEDPHVWAFAARLAAMRSDVDGNDLPSATFNVPMEHVLPDQGAILPLPMLDDHALVEMMDEFHRNGGYEYRTLRDQLYYREIDGLIDAYMGAAEGQRILDLCCGTNRLQQLLAGAVEIVGIDVSGVAVELARQRSDPRFRFQIGDAHRLDFEDGSFDAVIFCEAAEHVRHIEPVLAEVARVLRPGGALFISAANTESLNQIMSRKLGYGGFVTNWQHFREFSYAEMIDLLQRVDLAVERTDGLMLYPYFGIPGVDETVRPLTDDDPEVVDLMRVLGKRVGPEHAYAFTMLARKAWRPARS